MGLTKRVKLAWHEHRGRHYKAAAGRARRMGKGKGLLGKIFSKSSAKGAERTFNKLAARKARAAARLRKGKR